MPHTLGGWDGTDCLVFQGRMGLQRSLWLVGLGTGGHRPSRKALCGCTQPVGCSSAPLSHTKLSESAAGGPHSPTHPSLLSRPSVAGSRCLRAADAGGWMVELVEQMNGRHSPSTWAPQHFCRALIHSCLSTAREPLIYFQKAQRHSETH